MKNIFKEIYDFFFAPLDIAKLTLENFLSYLKEIRQRIPIRSIEKIYHVYSEPLYEGNYSIIIEELSTFHSFGPYKIEMGDYISFNIVESEAGEKLLTLKRFTPDFNRKDPYFFLVDDFPKFSDDRTLIYENRIYYSRIKNPPIEPVYISDEMLKKAKLL